LLVQNLVSSVQAGELENAGIVVLYP
jgi:hypothetical protein